MRSENTIARKFLKRVLATVLVALAGLSLSGCAKPLTLEESASKIVSDLQQLSGAIEDFTSLKGHPPRRGAVSGDFGKDLMAAGVLRRLPTPPMEVKRPDCKPDFYKYEYYPEFDELGGPTAKGDDAALWLPGISVEACRRINLQNAGIGDKAPIHREEGYLSGVSVYCSDYGGPSRYSVIKYLILR